MGPANLLLRESEDVLGWIIVSFKPLMTAKALFLYVKIKL